MQQPHRNCLLEPGIAFVLFHGHSTPIISQTQVTHARCALGDIAFSHDSPGIDGWAILDYDK